MDAFSLSGFLLVSFFFTPEKRQRKSGKTSGEKRKMKRRTTEMGTREKLGLYEQPKGYNGWVITVKI